MEKLYRKITLFLVLGLLIVIIGIPQGLYFLTQNGGGALAGTVTLFVVFTILPVLLLDRYLVTKVAPKKVALFELALVLLSIAYIAFK